LEQERTVRRLGDFSDFDQSQADQFRRLLVGCDLSRYVYVYVRQSKDDGAGTHAGYKMDQEKLHDILVEAGVPSVRIKVLKDDTNKSGALSQEYRDDLRKLDRACERGEVGLIVCQAVDRLFRDPYMVGPVEFGNMLGAQRVKVLRAVKGEFDLLDMATEAAKEKFRKEAQDAANERTVIRDRSMRARENYALEGAAGSKPTPFGWRRLPKVAAHLSPTGKYIPSVNVVYGPHAIIKLKIMMLANRPEINTVFQLYKALIAEKLVPLPPFEQAIAAENVSKSIYYKTWIPDPSAKDGKRRPRVDDWINPGPTMIKGILLEPLTLGDRWYGCGRSGHDKMNAERERLNLSRQQVYAKINEGKSFAGNSPEQALWNADPAILEELDLDREKIEALYWSIVDKWSYVDYHAARESGVLDFTEGSAKLPVNEKRRRLIRQPGRPRERVTGSVNYWAGKIFCAKHPDNTHPITYLKAGDGWICTKDKDSLKEHAACCFWGQKNALRKVLDWYLLSMLRAEINKNHALIRNHDTESSRIAAELQYMEEEIAGLNRELDYQKARLEANQRVWHAEGEDMEALSKEQYAQHIKPRRTRLAHLNTECQVLRTELSRLDYTETQEEFEARVQSILDKRDGISPENMRDLVQTFIESVRVLIGDGVTAKEVVLEVKWKGGRRDVLISWRGSAKDHRPWEPWEDEALKKLWPARSGASYENVLQHLLPGRRFPIITERITQLGVVGMRPREFRKQALASDKHWIHDKPGVLYLQFVGNVFVKSSSPLAKLKGALLDDNGLTCGVAGTHELGQFIDMPADVRQGLRVLFGINPPSCPSHGDNDKDRPNGRVRSVVS